MNALIIHSKSLHQFAFQAFLHSGVSQETAIAISDCLVLASLRGIDSHGIRLLPHYIDAIRSGRINRSPKMVFEKTSDSTSKLDANHGSGIMACNKAMEHAINLANQAGIGVVIIANSNHCGMMANYALFAAHNDMIGFALTNVTPRLKTPNASKPFFGNNPVCVAAPMKNEPPFCYDSALSVITGNKIKLFAELGLPLPKLAAADENGLETLNPQEAKQLYAIGGYKGFGLAMVVDVFCSLLSGMPSGPDVSNMYEDPIEKKRYLGQFVGAINISAFENPYTFKERLQILSDKIRNSPSIDSKEGVMIPGDPEKRMEAYRCQHGIPIPENVFHKLQKIADDLGLCLAPNNKEPMMTEKE